MKIVIVTGGFDPIHSGHIEYFKAAKKLGDKLIVGVNSDAWLTRKKGRPFMPVNERVAIISEFKIVDMTFPFDEDTDADGSAINFIKQILSMFPDDEVIFANGGDRTPTNIPEMSVTSDRLHFVFGVGGENKQNSSRWILEEWRKPKTARMWGYYRVLHEYEKTAKVKELVVEPDSCLSMQRHAKRSEIWFVAEGNASVYTLNRSTDYELTRKLNEHEFLVIAKNEWHMLCNESHTPLKLVEIQYGENCVEEDIERKFNAATS
jgi:cytidyltransferase-like protein